MPRPPDPQHPDLSATLTAWLAEHPEATLAEIERAVDRELCEVRAAMISQAAQVGERDERPDCPACGAPMHRSRRRTIRQTTAHNGEVVLDGQEWRCPACGAGFFPPD